MWRSAVNYRVSDPVTWAFARIWLIDWSLLCIFDFDFNLACYAPLLDHSVNVSQWHRLNSVVITQIRSLGCLLPKSQNTVIFSHIRCNGFWLTGNASVLLQAIYATSTVKYRSNTDFIFRNWWSAFCVLKSAWHRCSNNHIAVLWKWLFIVRTLQFSIYYCITCISIISVLIWSLAFYEIGNILC